MTNPLGDLSAFLDAHAEVAIVRVRAVKGSTPRGTDAWMLVSATARLGTVGGGQLEYIAIDEARALLAKHGPARDLSIPLGPGIGQCCGGRVALTLARLGRPARAGLLAQERERRRKLPAVHLFGAGHVGRALADALALLPVRVVLVDTREAELARAAVPAERLLTAVPEDVVREAAPGGAFVVLTHDHALDFLIAREALARGDARYVGMIGSKTKRASFEKWCREVAGDRLDTRRLTCPIGARGGGSGDKRPEVIAAFAAAEIIARLTAPARKARKVAGVRTT